MVWLGYIFWVARRLTGVTRCCLQLAAPESGSRQHWGAIGQHSACVMLCVSAASLMVRVCGAFLSREGQLLPGCTCGAQLRWRACMRDVRVE
jgi:hypothetical protein